MRSERVLLVGESNPLGDDEFFALWRSREWNNPGVREAARAAVREFVDASARGGSV